MVFDSITNASIPTHGSKDLGKKKRVNRSAKLKQCKLDVRREQWLSQVKNKGLGFKEETNVTSGVKMDEVKQKQSDAMAILEVSVGVEESDSESVSNSPSVFSGSGCSYGSSSSSGSSSSGGAGGCFSRSVTDEDYGDHDGNEHDGDDSDDCLDDWEAMADALEEEADDGIEKNHKDEAVCETMLKPEPVCVPVTVKPGQVDLRAWRLDDASRPQSLPNLLKHNSFPMNLGVCHGVQFAPSSCPICCEDLDMTDSSFLPCPCGYRLCLFCHKKIVEDNGRCPGCRKQYDQIDNKSAPFKLTRCYSVNARY